MVQQFADQKQEMKNHVPWPLKIDLDCSLFNKYNRKVFVICFVSVTTTQQRTKQSRHSPFPYTSVRMNQNSFDYMPIQFARHN